MTHLVGIRLRNVGRFRGEHVLELGPKVYAVTACDLAEEEASNARGKSTLAEAVRYALFGLALRPHRTLDECISSGEDEMLVELEWSDGYFVSRRRVRGRFTDLQVEGHEGEQANQDEAQRAILNLLRMTQDDYDVCGHVAQKAADRLVVDVKGGGLADLIVGWAGLEKLGAAEDIAAARLSSWSKKKEANIQRIAALPKVEAGEVERLRKEIAELEDKKAAEERRRTEVTEHNARVRERAVHVQNALRAAQLRDALTVVREEANKIKSSNAVLEQARARLKDAEIQSEPKRLKVEQARAVAGGQFDGKCPVAGIECPARALINDDRRAARERLKVAAEDLEQATVKVEHERARVRASEQLANHSRNAQREADRIEAQLAALRDSEVWLEKNPDPGPELPVTFDDVAPGLAWKREKLRQAERAVADAAALDDEAMGLSEEVEIRRLALAAIEATSARVATTCGRAVEDGANRRLERAGVDLRVQFRWGRETQKPAARCAGCGASFPASARVKQCSACGAPRGFKLDDRPYLKIQPRSGGLEDLAGVALSLSAGEWLRARRGSSWASVWLDEPFSGLDPMSRAALRSHLLAVVSAGWEQVFLTAHTRDVLDSLPGRIVVTGDGPWSRVEVVA